MSDLASQIKLDDFRFFWDGKPIRCLNREDLPLIAPIQRRGPQTRHALLLLHGFGSTPAVYRRLLPLLPAYDAIVCPILPGHAASIRVFAAVKATAWQAVAQQTCKELIQSYQRVDVLGLSLGGLLAWQLSQTLPLHHVYMLAPALALRHNVSLLLCCARILQALGFFRLRNHAGNLYIPDYAELTYSHLPLSSIIEILSLIKTTQLTIFRAPRCSIDVFLGRHDAVIDNAYVAQYIGILPQAHLVWLERSAHVLPLDGDLEVIAARVQADFNL